MAKTMRRKYICTNGVVEVTQYVVGDKTATTGKKWRKAKSLEDKRDENARQAVRVAARILNCNYTPEDYLVELTYSDESAEKVLGVVRDVEIATSAAPPRNDKEETDCHVASLLAMTDADEIWEKARGILAKKLEQVRRSAKKDGVEVKTFAVTSDLDQETGELVRVHHHVVVNAAGLELLQKKWNHGLVLHKNLYRQDDYTPLAAYLLGQVRHAENRKKYSCSRNMVQPKVQKMVLQECPANELRVQPGAKVLDRTQYREGCVSQYVRYKRKPATRKRGGHKGGGDCGGGNGIEIATSAASPRNDKQCCTTSGGSEFCKHAKGGSEK